MMYRICLHHLSIVEAHKVELSQIPGAVVGEWSLAREEDFKEQDVVSFALAQVRAYDVASHGWFFWNWHDYDHYNGY